MSQERPKKDRKGGRPKKGLNGAERKQMMRKRMIEENGEERFREERCEEQRRVRTKRTKAKSDNPIGMSSGEDSR